MTSSLSGKDKKSSFDTWISRDEITPLFNPFVPNAPFLYPLKASENLTVF